MKSATAESDTFGDSLSNAIARNCGTESPTNRCSRINNRMCRATGGVVLDMVNQKILKNGTSGGVYWGNFDLQDSGNQLSVDWNNH